jgi:predicted RNase H-like HicB family nuclease
MEITVVVHQERDGFWSEVEGLPGCFASGRTLTELGEALAESICLYMDEDRVVLPDSPLSVGTLALNLSLPREAP